MLLPPVTGVEEPRETAAAAQLKFPISVAFLGPIRAKFRSQVEY
jgi:hypothetical protein